MHWEQAEVSIPAVGSSEYQRRTFKRPFEGKAEIRNYNIILPNHLMRAGFLLGKSSILNMEAIFLSETSVNVQSTRCHIPDDGNILNYSCENIKSYIPGDPSNIYCVQ
jgi:hypothetical protein